MTPHKLFHKFDKKPHPFSKSTFQNLTKCEYFSKFPIIRMLSCDMQLNNTHTQINTTHTSREDDKLFLKPLRSSSCLSSSTLIPHLRLNSCLLECMAQRIIQYLFNNQSIILYSSPYRKQRKKNPTYLPPSFLHSKLNSQNLKKISMQVVFKNLSAFLLYLPLTPQPFEVTKKLPPFQSSSQ